ncbi:glycine-rich domain-containing protein [Escherichia coli]
MRALLTPEIAPRMGIVLFRPGSELMPLFMQGRVLLEPEPERYSSFASGAVPAASQPLADDPAVRAVFRNEAVIRRAGGVECLESWLLREKGCQWPHSDWHSENMTTMRHAPGAIRLCWHCDNQLRDQFTERLESMATDNCARWMLSVVRRDLGFDDSHVVTMPELCWWLVRNDLADALPESAARKALRLPKPVVPSVTRESDLVPSVFTSSGTYTPTPGTKRIRVTITGGGGGGGGCKAISNNETFFGAGGGAGGTVITTLILTKDSYPVTIGAGGAGGVSATYGINGGNSLFASLIAPGGAGGGKSGVTNTNGGNGGVPSTGDINIIGGCGGDGQSGNIGVSGEGGTSYWGGGGRAGAGGGVSGKAYGSGGGGAYDAGYSGTSMTGGKGAAGICIIEEFA